MNNMACDPLNIVLSEPLLVAPAGRSAHMFLHCSAVSSPPTLLIVPPAIGQPIRLPMMSGK